MERELKGKRCGPGEIRIDRKGYTRKDGTRVGRTTYCAEDQGSPGVVSRGAKQGRHKGEKKWITHEGKLGGPGYTKKTAAQRHKILDKCVKKVGYRSCLGSIMVLLRSSEISAEVRKKLTADKNYLERKYGGPGSFGPRKNPDEPCCDACAIGKPCESGCDDHGHERQENGAMRKYTNKDDARTFAASQGLYYGHSVFSKGWYVGTPAELKKIGVVEFSKPLSEEAAQHVRSEMGLDPEGLRRSRSKNPVDVRALKNKLLK